MCNFFCVFVLWGEIFPSKRNKLQSSKSQVHNIDNIQILQQMGIQVHNIDKHTNTSTTKIHDF